MDGYSKGRVQPYPYYTHPLLKHLVIFLWTLRAGRDGADGGGFSGYVFFLYFDQGMGDKPVLAIKRLLIWFRVDRDVGAIGLQAMGIDRIEQDWFEHMLFDGLAQNGSIEGEEGLNAIIEIALHQVSAAQENLLLTIVAEVIDAAVLQEASHNATHVNILADPLNTWTQTAHTPDDEINADPSLRGAIEQIDHPGIGERVGFEDETPVAILLVQADLTLDAFGEATS